MGKRKRIGFFSILFGDGLERLERRERAAAMRQARKRDDHKCHQCGSRGPLHVHHKRHRSRGGSNRPRNLVTLCVDCHTKEHPKRADFIRSAGETPRWRPSAEYLAMQHKGTRAFFDKLREAGKIRTKTYKRAIKELDRIFLNSGNSRDVMAQWIGFRCHYAKFYRVSF